MDPFDRLRQTILSAVIRDIPVGFWRDARVRLRQAYLDVFHEVGAYPTMLDEQRLEKLGYERYFRMEWLFAELCRAHGIVCTPTLLTYNSHTYVFAAVGSIGLTQTYVPAIGDLPQPARFRERLAAMNYISAAPRLLLGDEPQEVFVLKDFYGLIVHNPVGKRFTESDQRLGMIQFCVPTRDFSQWGLQLSLEEIIAAHEVIAPKEAPDRSLPWKKQERRGNEGE